MPRLAAVVMAALTAGCGPARAAALTEAHAAAMKDSLEAFMTAHAEFMSAYPASDEGRCRSPFEVEFA